MNYYDLFWLSITYAKLFSLSLIAGWLCALCLNWYKNRLHPKGFKFDPRKTPIVDTRPITDSNSKHTHKRGDILRDRYKWEKVSHPNEWDAIVIGSGIGGLSTAAFLSRLGWRVLVLEQHYLAGGSTHAFEDRGYEHETGIHYIGNIQKRQKVLDLITETPISWTQLGHEQPDGRMIYDKVVIDSETDDGDYITGDQMCALIRLVQGVDKQKFLDKYGLVEMDSDYPLVMKVKGPRVTLEKLEQQQDQAQTSEPDEVDLIDFVPVYAEHTFQAGAQNWLEDLVRKFPNERDNLERYLALIQQVAKKDTYFLAKIIRPTWLRRFFQRWFCNDFYRWATISAAEVINQTTDDTKLRAILGGQFGDYGPPPEEASFMMHASVVNHYLEGGYYPTGGSSQFARQIIPVIERAGGRVLVDKGVNQILIEQPEDNENVYRVWGVEMDNGDRIAAPIVVSSAGLSQTYNRLLSDEPEAVKLCGWPKIEANVKPSTSFFFLFVDLEGSPEELGLSSANIWCYPHKNYREMLQKFAEDPFTKPMPMFIASASAKDKDWSTRYPGKSSVVILTMGSKSWMESQNLEKKISATNHKDLWEHQRCMHRDTDYQEVKERMAQRLLNEGLYRFYPKTRGRVKHYQVGSPLTIQHYLGAPEGQAYGIDASPQRFGPDLAEYLTPETPVEGLYLSGQDICTLGFTGALMGGLLAAHSILGYGTLDDLVTGRNLVDDLIKMEDLQAEKI